MQHSSAPSASVQRCALAVDAIGAGRIRQATPINGWACSSVYRHGTTLQAQGCLQHHASGAMSPAAGGRSTHTLQLRGASNYCQAKQHAGKVEVGEDGGAKSMEFLCPSLRVETI